MIIGYMEFDKLSILLHGRKLEIGSTYGPDIFRELDMITPLITFFIDPLTLIKKLHYINGRYCEISVPKDKILQYIGDVVVTTEITINKILTLNKLVELYILSKKDNIPIKDNIRVGNVIINPYEKGEIINSYSSIDSISIKQLSNVITSAEYTKAIALDRFSYAISNNKKSLSLSTGNISKSFAIGEESTAISTGLTSSAYAINDGSNAIVTNKNSETIVNGSKSFSISTGKCSHSTTNNSNSIAAAFGAESKVRGVKGSWLVLVEWDENSQIKDVKTVQVDGVIIKENVFYTLKDGEIV